MEHVRNRQRWMPAVLIAALYIVGRPPLVSAQDEPAVPAPPTSPSAMQLPPQPGSSGTGAVRNPTAPRQTTPPPARATNSASRRDPLIAGMSKPKFAPNMIGDFWGSSSSQISVPAETPLGQAIFIIPTTGDTYFRQMLPTKANPTVFQSTDTVFVTTTPAGTLTDSNPNGGTGFIAYDGSNFTGLQRDLGPVTATNVTLSPSATRTDSFIFNPPESSDPQRGNSLFDAISVGEQLISQVSSPSAGGFVGRLKIAENSSPIPRDRVFFNFSEFDNVPLSPQGVNVHRYSPGFERTFWNGLASWEFRAPFASTLNSDLQSVGETMGGDMQLGNMVNYLKFLLYTNETFALSAGLGVTAPTGQDIKLVAPDDTTILRVKNDSVHVLPFLGTLWTPTDQLFVQSFLQIDLGTNGDRVELSSFNSNGGPTGALREVGTLNDATFLYYTLSAGYWIYENPDSGRLITGLAPMIELNYNRSLQTEDFVTAPGAGGTYQVGAGAANLEILNGTLGLTALVGSQGTVTTAYVMPIGSGADQQFDGELRVFFNWYFK